MKGQVTFSWRALIFLIPILIFVGIFFFGYATTYEVPANMKITQITGGLAKFLTYLAIPPDWLYTPALVYLFIVPFLGVWIVVWGFLREIKIFNIPNINGLLSFIIAFSTIPLGFFVKMVATLFATIGTYSIWAFGFLAVMGISWVVLQRLTTWGFTGAGTYRGLALENRYNQLRDWLLTVDHANAGHPAVRGIPAVLNRAQANWNAGHNEQAVRELENHIAAVRNRLPGVPPAP